MKEFPKAFEAKKYEDEIYKKWENSGFFNPDACISQGLTNKKTASFSVVLPPPNVTGTLHMGHAVMLAIQDLMTRYHRMKGDKTLWLPGTDHAAIATQTKVEKLLLEKGMKDPKKELGREKFLVEVDKFAKESHDIIVNQCKKMGSSLDWSREAFTLDKQRSLAVRAVFKKMYDDGLIYRGYRIVNWCPRCQSTLADDEVEYKEQMAKLYTFKYSVDFPITISTTRPETKLGDTAVAVNPKDKRYKKYIGQEFVVKKFVGGSDLKIKIIADNTVGMDFGTGAVGVTPAHSFADYEMYLKNKLDFIPVIDEDGLMTYAAGDEYACLSVLKARQAVVENLETEGLIEKIEDIPSNLSVCYRCGTAVEPLPSKQWFISVSKKFKVESKKLEGIKSGKEYNLKELMQAVVKSGQIEIIPERFQKTYFTWVDNLRDWCISRQIWYGHRIPVWYHSTCQAIDSEGNSRCGEAAAVGELEESAKGTVKCLVCGEEDYVGIFTQDEGTLDTWFSSGLWTFSTLGWPENTANLKTFHPTSVLETGYDILFFWVARMILMTTYVLGDIPFEKVYLHGLVRDEQGRKMSKSLGNVIDPLDMIKSYGADATRLSLLLGNTPGNDIKLSEEKIAGFRNFTNKLWNIARFIQLQINNQQLTINRKPKAKTLADRWVLLRLQYVVIDITTAIEKYQFSSAGERLREFTWDELADWYLEIAKIEGNKSEILNYILNTILKLWHPFMPFVTEQIWSEVYGIDKMLMVEKWPMVEGKKVGNTTLYKNINPNTIEFEIIQNIITGIRSLRADKKIEPAKKINVIISAGKHQKVLEENSEIIKGLARLGSLQINKTTDKPANSVGFMEGGVEVFLDLTGAVDMEKEMKRLKVEMDQVKKYVDGLSKKLDNHDFIKNAPAAVVKKERQKLVEAKEKMKKLKAQLSDLA